MTRRILLCEPQCAGFVHVPFNAALLATVLAAWPDPEVTLNVNTDELGDLGLTQEEEAAIVAFMETLTD